MAINIEFSQYGDAIEARITDGESPGCELIKGTKGKIGELLGKRLESLGVPCYCSSQEGSNLTTNNLKLFDEILGIPPMSELLKTNPEVYIPGRETES
ncbi:TPA: hypothetical protein DCZ36_02495 [Candidatus Gracilibacteria bacterium]|nr:hypothetical protein [Candidatus Gracilibacteria bacterium]